MRSKIALLALTLVLIALLLAPALARAQEPGILLASQFTGVVAEAGSKVTLALKVINQAKTPRQVALSLSAPPSGWEVGFWKPWPEAEVRRLYLLSEETVELEFRAQTPQDAAPGEYSFTLEAKAPDASARLQVTIAVKKAVAEAGGIKLESSYPVLSGASGTSFEFRIDMKNQTSEDRSFDLTATPPQGWTVTIKPQWEQKQISSISVKKGETSSVTLTITSPPLADPGDYPIPFTARSVGVESSIQLKVTIIGRYSLGLATSTGLLNTRAQAGLPTVLALLVGNTGTAPLTGVNLYSTAAPEWKVTFDPQLIDQLKANEERQVTVAITPRAKAIPGDYALVLSARSGETTQYLNLRVTVTTATAWGAIGVGIVVVVLAALVGLFIRLGRR